MDAPRSNLAGSESTDERAAALAFGTDPAGADGAPASPSDRAVASTNGHLPASASATVAGGAGRPNGRLRARGRPLAPTPLPDTAAVRRAQARLAVAGLDGEPSGAGLARAGDAPRRDEVVERSHRHRRAIEWMAVLAGALLMALAVKVLLLQAFVIPSESMVPTLGVGDRVLVNKASYRVGEVGRGDLVVFERPATAESSDDADLIKRVVGLPGETIEATDGIVYVDGKPLVEQYLPRSARTDDFPATNVGLDEVFVMGDNRQSSRDSRSFGPVPVGTVIGRAFLRVWPPGDVGGL